MTVPLFVKLAPATVTDVPILTVRPVPVVLLFVNPLTPTASVAVPFNVKPPKTPVP